MPTPAPANQNQARNRTRSTREVGSGNFAAKNSGSCRPPNPIDKPLYEQKTKAEPTSAKPMRGTRDKHTHEERSRGGKNKAALIREANYTIIDAKLPEYLAAVGREKCFVMARFIEYALPHLKDVKGAVIRYGAYMKARLKYFVDMECVKAFGRRIDAIKRGIAKKAGKLFAGGLFETMNGYFMRVCGKPSKTSNRFAGAAWQVTMGCWGYFENRDTGECFQ